jgi:iron complex outermembrane receptor protein
VAGFNTDEENEHRRGYQNFVGSTLGVLGALRRDEDNRVRNIDFYAYAEFAASPDLSVTLGARSSEVRFGSTDHYIVPGNGDDSGSATYRKATPAAGVTFKVSPALNAYAAWGRGFETPTFNELAYRPDGQTGLNFALRPSVSDSAEIGLKWHGANARSTFALFDAHTDDELSVLSNTGGRSTFQNVGATRRRGAEWSLHWELSEGLEVNASASYIDARYFDAFLTCVAAPCGSPNTPVAAGNRLPAVPATSAYAELAWNGAGGTSAALEAKRQAKLQVNDVNSDAAGAYTVAAVRAGYEWRKEKWRFRMGTRIDNLFDKRYAATVIVNEGNGRYFEPAPGRTWLATLSVQYDI